MEDLVIDDDVVLITDEETLPVKNDGAWLMTIRHYGSQGAHASGSHGQRDF